MSSSLNIYTIHGIIQPIEPCYPESTTNTPILTGEETAVDLNDLIALRDHFEEGAEVCERKHALWKYRTIIQMATIPDILSITFFPSNHRKHDLTSTYMNDQMILFIQKKGMEEQQIGFVNPFLTSEQQMQWQALPSFPISYCIRDESSIKSALSGIPATLIEGVQTCLRYFLLDPTSSALGLTFKNDKGAFITYGWMKA